MTAAVPVSATNHAHTAQKQRAARYGIPIRPGGHLTKPAAFAHVPDSEWGDPVNYAYPMPEKEHADDAASRFAGEQAGYGKGASVIAARIRRRQRHFAEPAARTDAKGTDLRKTLPVPVLVSLAKALPAYQQTRDGIRAHPPAADGSITPLQAEHHHRHLPSLADTAADPNALAHALGRDGPAEHNMTHLANRVRRGAPLTIYRAGHREREIRPGGVVTLSLAAARQQATAQAHASTPVNSRVVAPHELTPVGNGRHFWYTPASVDDWHRTEVGRALRTGQTVPRHVLREQGLSQGNVVALKSEPGIAMPTMSRAL